MTQERLTIAGTERSPEVDFDFASGRFSMRGESYPEDAAAFFGPIFDALRRYLQAPAPDGITLDIEFIYFNSSSAKALMNILEMLEKSAADGTRVEINWHYADDDDTMKEFGEDFSEDLEHVTFNLVSVDG
ncbi:DUF1987 domain-containing protein [Telmatospirillum sp. J64-1]|uniref:DUF1987 domain-containing protein n=1 Tax=Telmatospirillum sp. J64-1 TaxID=2502183 RepID=UPI00115E9A0F|nr:DUF1987 domain-containing protein [Telmatospirillum sp. J64-1]